MGISEEILKRPSGRLSLQGVGDLDPNLCRHISVVRLSQSIGNSVRFRWPHVNCGNSTVDPNC